MSELLASAEAEIKKLQELISVSDSTKKDVLSEQLKRLDFDQDTAVMQFLEKTDKEYDAVVQENFDLLENNRIEFEVLREEPGVFKSHAKQLSGKFDGSSFDCKGVADYNSFIHCYPFNYYGIINYFGESDMYMEKRKLTIVSSLVPKKYTGFVNADGGLYVEATGGFWENSGKLYVRTLQADLFSGDTFKKEKFIKNRLILKEMIAKLRERLG